MEHGARFFRPNLRRTVRYVFLHVLIHLFEASLNRKVLIWRGILAHIKCSGWGWDFIYSVSDAVSAARMEIRGRICRPDGPEPIGIHDHDHNRNLSYSDTVPQRQSIIVLV